MLRKFPAVKPAQVCQNRKESEERLRGFAALPSDALLRAVSTAAEGLTSERAETLLDELGPNKITAGHKNTPIARLREAVVNPFNIVLLIIALITLVTDVFVTRRPDWITILIIVSLVALSSLVAFVQGERSNSAAEKLSRMIENKADVFRDGKQTELLIESIVPGDVIRLSAGDLIPADVRFLTAKDAFVAQAALTGESSPVEKTAQPADGKADALTDLANIGFMGSNMVSGSATAVVLATGDATFFGAMAGSLSSGRGKNSFERGVDSVSRLLLRLMLTMVPVIFLVNGLTKGDWIQALLFAVTVSVGLTPEMLPVIMTSTLAKGAVSMSRRQVIVKSLGAIQTFGEMDVLCTDKTGTLTEDKIVLERYLNVRGNDDMRVLRHAFLNSHFQTGLKNLIDVAIIHRADKMGISAAAEGYARVDEIPFDFSRRRMSVVLENASGKRQLITKGAVEELISISSFIEMDGAILPMTEENKRQALAVNDRYNADGLRMIAVAQKNEVPGVAVFSAADEADMVLIGFVGFLDPPKESAKAAIAALQAHGVRTVVLTGDAEGVAVKVCQKVGVNAGGRLTGRDVETMDDEALGRAVMTCDLFSKLSPSQKERVVHAFQTAGHTVGYMGDGINDAPPLHRADVGISVDTAVDIAKETADIILLRKDLTVLDEGVIEGRRTFGNIVKYIKMAASGNFGNMISVTAASILLPFLPMLPVQILTQNLLCDFSQMGIPFDNTDREFIEKPRKWDTRSIRSFMSVMGPLSSVFDLLCFAALWWAIGANKPELSPLFHCGWFVFGTASQIAVIHMIRTARTPLFQSNASLQLYGSTIAVMATALLIGFTPIASALEMAALPASFAPWLLALLAAYCLASQAVKRCYIKRRGEWL